MKHPATGSDATALRGYGPLIFAILAVLGAGAWLSIGYGVDFTDMGFIEGSAYRIFRGQTIYRDFDYIRPPLTPWLWHFPFYAAQDGLEILIRSLVILQKAVIGVLLSGTLSSFGVTVASRRLVGLLAFAFLLFWLPAMPWHTVDGLFFISLAAWLFARGWFAAALCAALAAALCKQSFYAAPLLMSVLVLLADRSRFPAAAIATGLLMLAVALYFDLGAFAQMSRGTNQISDVFTYGIAPHFLPTKGFVFGLAAPLVVALVFRLLHRPVLKPMFLTILLTQALPLVRGIELRLVNGVDVGMSGVPGLSHGAAALTFATIALLLFRQRRNPLQDRSLLVASFLAAGAWMSSLSWGGPNYLPAFGLLLAAAALSLKGELTFEGRTAAGVALAVVTILALSRSLTPFIKMESPLLVPHDMVLAGHYHFIRVSPREADMLASLSRIAAVSGCKDTYPSAPQSALLGRYDPALRADWKMDVEYPTHDSAAEQAKIPQCHFFVERETDIPAAGIYKSTFLPQSLIKACARPFDSQFLELDGGACEAAKSK